MTASASFSIGGGPTGETNRDNRLGKPPFTKFARAIWLMISPAAFVACRSEVILRASIGCSRIRTDARRPALASGSSLATLALAGVLLLSPPSYAFDNECTRAALLWVPSVDGQDGTIRKWTKAIRFAVVAGDGKLATDTSRHAEKSVEDDMTSMAGKARLDVVSRSRSNEDLHNIDFLIFVVPDLAAFAPGLREAAERFLQAKPQAAAGRIRIDSAAWDRKSRDMVPKCSSLSLYSGGEIVGAFAMIQDDQPAACRAVGLGELFGLSNIRKHYVDNGQSVAAETTALALQSLYSDAIRPGMGEPAAREKLEEICKCR
jgi:hypothetical protein